MTIKQNSLTVWHFQTNENKPLLLKFLLTLKRLLAAWLLWIFARHVMARIVVPYVLLAFFKLPWYVVFRFFSVVDISLLIGAVTLCWAKIRTL